MLPATEAALGKALRGYDLILVAGATAFRFYPHVPGPVLGTDAELVLLTDDPGEAARAAYGEAVLTDPVAALTMLARDVPRSRRAAKPPGGAAAGPGPEPVRPDGPLTAAGAYAAIVRVLPADGVLVCESVSNMRDWQDQIRFSRPGSYYSPAGVSLGFGVPAAIGVQLADPDRRVVAVVGDGSGPADAVRRGTGPKVPRSSGHGDPFCRGHRRTDGTRDPVSTGSHRPPSSV